MLESAKIAVKVKGQGRTCPLLFDSWTKYYTLPCDIASKADQFSSCYNLIGNFCWGRRSSSNLTKIWSLE